MQLTNMVLHGTVIFDFDYDFAVTDLQITNIGTADHGNYATKSLTP
jgi:hypothetical protein